MLVLRRKEGQWIEITHRSGDKIRVRVCNIRARYPGQLDMVLDDPERHFQIQRAERPPRPRDIGGETHATSLPVGHADAPPALGSSLGDTPALGIMPGVGFPDIPIGNP